MRFVNIDKAEEGMKLAKPIYDINNRILLGNGSIVSKEYIAKLAERGLPGFYIDDDLSKDVDIEEVISQELRNIGVDALRKGDIDGTIKIADDIVEQLLRSPIVSLDMVDLRSFDDYTYRHSVNVAIIATVIGMNLQFNRLKLGDLCVAAILHDIGKTSVDANILNKKGKLTPEEFAQVKKHSTYAYDMLKERLDIAAVVKSAIVMHHENEDGTGYPKGYKDNQIHIYAKIIHVADVFDALTSKRPYKDAYARAEAVEYLMGNCGRLFDAKVVSAFLKSVSLYPVGVTVKLSTGQEGIIIKNNDTNTLRPLIKLMNGEIIDLSDLEKNRNITILPDNDVLVE